MKLGLSTYLFKNEKLTPSLLDTIHVAGFDDIEIFCAQQHFNPQDRAQVREIAQWFLDRGLKLHSLHTPIYRLGDETSPLREPLSIAATEKRLRIFAVDEIKRAIEAAEWLPMKIAVVHLGAPGDTCDLRKFDAAFSSLEELHLFAHDRNVRVAVENILNELTRSERLHHFFEFTHLESVGVCFDSGHAHIQEDAAKFYDLLKDRILTTHIHDNHKASDDHLLPKEGSIAWSKLTKLMKQASSTVPLMMELRAGESPHQQLRKAAQCLP